MSRLGDIPIRIESMESPVPDRPDGGLGGAIDAVLSEIASLLERLAKNDEHSMIDLRSLPLSQADRAALQSALGDGEVHATLQAVGRSTARETRFAGVWWLEHRDPAGDLVAELLEVARFPQILASAPDEIADAAKALRSHRRLQ